MTLYEQIEQYVKKSSLAYAILKKDKSLTLEDLISTIYLNRIDKNQDYIFSRIKQDLLNIYSKAKKRQDILSKNISNMQFTTEISTEHIFLKEIALKKLKEYDLEAFKCVNLHFLQDKPYDYIAKELKISIRTVKRKIDLGLSYLKSIYTK